MDVLKNEVEAILFAAGRVVLLKEFQSLLRVKESGIIKDKIKILSKEYEERDSPLLIIEEEDGWKLTVKERFLGTVHTINPHTELSKSVLETLSVIAWKNPVLQSDVIRIRTNKAYDHISELERLGFISRERSGRSYIIKATQKFLDYFDLPDSKAIKDAFKEFKDIESAVQRKVDDFEKEQSRIEQEEVQTDFSGSINSSLTSENSSLTSENSLLTSESQGNNSAKLEEHKSKLTEKSNSSIELEPYIDVLPEEDKPKHETELEIYEPVDVNFEKKVLNIKSGKLEHKNSENANGISDESKNASVQSENISEESKNISVQSENISEESKNTSKESKNTSEKTNDFEDSEYIKAQRIAQELLGEDVEQESEEKHDRKLHPKLEEFIEGEEIPHKTIPEPRNHDEFETESDLKSSVEKIESNSKGSSPEGFSVEKSGLKSEQNNNKTNLEHSSSIVNHDDKYKSDEISKHKTAEEFPGQFKSSVENQLAEGESNLDEKNKSDLDKKSEFSQDKKNISSDKKLDSSNITDDEENINSEDNLNS